MIYFKQCPKCKGDLYDAEDRYGKHIKCLQCGYSDDPAIKPHFSAKEPEYLLEERKRRKRKSL